VKTLVAVAAIVGWVVLSHAQRQREIRLAAYGVQLRVWEIRQNIEVRRYLSGQTDTLTLAPPPAWEGW
jgi:hypothetical protein